MSSLSLSDFTVAGTYVSAIAAAAESDRSNPKRHFECSEAHGRAKFLAGLIQRIATAAYGRGSAAVRLALRWV